MFIKYKIMKELNRIEFPNTIELNTLIKAIGKDNDKVLVAIDILGTDHYIVADDSLFPLIQISLRQISSYARYKHDIKIAFVSWFIKIASFIILIATLILTA